jgi:hypothetical protein
MLLDAEDAQLDVQNLPSLYLVVHVPSRPLGELRSAVEFLHPSSRILNCGCSRPWFIQRGVNLASTQHDAVRHRESRLGSLFPKPSAE